MSSAEGHARSMATTARALGNSEEERGWLDQLALLERLQAEVTEEVLRAVRDSIKSVNHPGAAHAIVARLYEEAVERRAGA